MQAELHNLSIRTREVHIRDRKAWMATLRNTCSKSTLARGYGQTEEESLSALGKSIHAKLSQGRTLEQLDQSIAENRGD